MNTRTILHSFRHLLLSLLLAAATTAPAWAVSYYTSGHGDIRMTYNPDTQSLYFHYLLDGTAIVDGERYSSSASNKISYATDALVTVIPFTPTLTRPAASSWDFTGAAAGDPLWYLPNAQQAGRPWLGFSTQDLKATDWSSNITITLIGATASEGGHFSLYFISAGTPNVLMDTFDGIGGDDVYTMSRNTHSHPTFLFTEPGRYDLTFRVSATHVTDGYKEAVGTFTFWVIPEPSTAGLLVLAAVAAGCAAYRRRERRHPRPPENIP